MNSFEAKGMSTPSHCPIGCTSTMAWSTHQTQYSEASLTFQLIMVPNL
jgi:hypothetical protein